MNTDPQLRRPATDLGRPRRRSLPRTGLLAAVALALLTACTGTPAPESTPLPSAASTAAPPETTPAAEPSTVEFAPAVAVVPAAETRTFADGAGSPIALTIAHLEATVTGVEPAIAEAFAAAVVSTTVDEVAASMQAYAALTIPDCAGGCERETSLSIENAGVYGDFGTVATRTGFTLGSRDRNPAVHSVTMNLRTGAMATLPEFLDLGDPNARARATAALAGAENWPYCSRETPEGYLSKALGFSPTDAGLLLLWPVDGTSTAECGVERVLVPWSDAAGTPATGTSSIDGRWCPTPESVHVQGCVTIAFPSATWDDGTAVDLVEQGAQAGGVSYAQPGAPFGVHYAAGTPIDLPDYYPGADLPEQERIWNGQTAVMLVRAE